MNSSYSTRLRRSLLLVVFILVPFFTYSQAKIKVRQTGAIVTDSNQEEPHSSAILDVSSSSLGVLFPQMSTATRDLIPSPAEGLLIYNTDKKTYEFYNGTEWLEMGIAPGSGGSGGTYDPDAQLVIDRMTDLSDLEKTAINDFIMAEKEVENYAKYDEFFLFSLGSTNGLIGFKSKTATAHGGVHWTTDGASFDGTGHIDTNWKPGDGGNYAIDDFIHEFFEKTAGTISGTKGQAGYSNGASGRSDFIYTGSLMLGGANSNLGTYNLIPSLGDNRLVARVRENSTNTESYLDGDLIQSQTLNSSSVPVGNFYVGALNVNGSANYHYDGTISTYLVGAGVDFDHTAHNTNVRRLLADLGIDLTPPPADPVQAALSRMTGLSATEESAITTFINAEVTAGNYDKYDEFFLFTLGQVNGLKGFKGTQATEHNGVTWTVDGASFDGVDDYINSGFAPSEGTNYTQNDALVGGFIKDIVNPSTTQVYWGTYVSSGSDRSSFMQSSVRRYITNGGALTSHNAQAGSNELYSNSRVEPTNHSLFLDGSSIDTYPSASGGLSTQPWYIGAENGNGSAASFSKSTISTFIVGAGIEFNHSAHNTNVRRLLADLGVDLTPAIVPSISFSTNWNDATDGAYSLTFAHTGTDFTWELPDGSTQTGNTLNIAANAGILDGTTKGIKIIGDVEKITSINVASKKLVGTIDFDAVMESCAAIFTNNTGVSEFKFKDGSHFTTIHGYSLGSPGLSGIYDFTDVQVDQMSLRGNTGITEIKVKQGTTMTNFWNSDCGLSGVLDMSNVTQTTSQFLNNGNNLTNILFKPGTQFATHFQIGSNNFTGTLDLSNVALISTNIIEIHDNPNLTDITWGTSNTPYTAASNRKFNNCDLGYMDLPAANIVDFNLNSIFLQDNGLTTEEVNHYLVDFDNNTTSGTATFDLSGTNAALDGASGGFDGLAAKASLEAKGFTVITNNPPFVSTWKTDNAGTSSSNQIILPTHSLGTYNFTVEWGDGTSDNITTWDQAETTHTYASPGTYDVTITGQFEDILVDQDMLKLLEIKNWGTLILGNGKTGAGHAANHFMDCSNLVITADGSLDMSQTTHLTNSFKGCSSLTSFPLINTSNVIGFQSAWEGCSSLTSFPAINTGTGALMAYTWKGCIGLTSFPSIDLSSSTNLLQTWYGCSGLTGFPVLDVSHITTFQSTWEGCSGLQSFPTMDFGNSLSMQAT